MSGQAGNRGYLIQSVIALLESLSRSDWTQLAIEPAFASDKIDISWYGSTGTKTCQVKSSVNQMNLPDVTRWAEELERESAADELTLLLVGPCSSSVARMGRHGKVAVPCPKSLDFEGLLGLAAHLLDGFLVQENVGSRLPSHRELMVRALVTELSIFACDGSPIKRLNFVEMLKTWVRGVTAPADLRWELVDFSHQRGIENAIAGKRLGPADVEQCPEFALCAQVVTELSRSHWYSIVGQRGCGKSVTAWQAAKKFHDTGYSVWRPRCSAESDELLERLPAPSPSLLVVDDAQQFGPGFVERLSEHSCHELKVIFTSTLTDVVTPNPSCISPTSGVDTLKRFVLERRNEVLPIVQRFDDRVGDRYMDVSFEWRVDDCARQETPWEFFWVLRGGWRTARAEYESLKQVPNANAILTAIALRQISSCDSGLSQDRLFSISNKLGLTSAKTDSAISHLASLGLVLISDDVFRTKHVSYAHRIVEESLGDENHATWPLSVGMLIDTALDTNTSLEGVYRLLSAVRMADAFRFDNGARLQAIREPLMSRCRDEWRHDEWAVGCASRLVELFRFSMEEMLADKELLLEWLTAGTGRIARFASIIANSVINGSDEKDKPETKNVAKSLFEQVDSGRLVGLANRMTLADFHSFGSLLNRLAFYGPSWSDSFLSQLDWPRMRAIILDADSSDAYAVDKLVGSLTLLTRRECGERNLQYVADIAPFIVRAIGEDPVHTIESMDDVFWYCLGLGPHFLRGGVDPDAGQLQIARSIVAQLGPADFALAMRDIISRDMENLARSLSIIHEVDSEFIRQIALLVPEEDFDRAARSDWRTQSRELRHLLIFFCIGKERQPARRWIARNEQFISGPLEPMLAGVAPRVAVDFITSRRGVRLTGREHRWNETVGAVAAIADVDKDICIRAVTDELKELEAALYALSLDPPKYIVTFFRLLQDLSEELFSTLIGRLNLDDPRAVKTINQLIKSQPRQLVNYRKLARLARRMGGDVGALGERLLTRLEEPSD